MAAALLAEKGAAEVKEVKSVKAREKDCRMPENILNDEDNRSRTKYTGLFSKKVVKQ